MIKKFFAIIISILIVSSVMTVAAEGGFTVEFVDVPETETTVEQAKVIVKAKGFEGTTSNIQLTFVFDGDLEFSDISFMLCEHDPDNGYVNVSTGTGVANREKKIVAASITSKEPFEIKDGTELFKLVFKGEKNATAEITVEVDEESYLIDENGDYVYNSKLTEKTVKASETGKTGTLAVVKLVMDKVLSFKALENAGIDVEFKNQFSEEITKIPLNSKNVSAGGHRDATVSTPTFKVENTVVADDKYTVTVSGIGYVTYTQKDINFSETEIIEIDNSKFIPGDIIFNGKVNGEDKKAFETAKAEGNIIADFDRSGTIDDWDYKVFDGIIIEDTEDDKTDDTTGGDTTGGTTGGGAVGGGGGGGGAAPAPTTPEDTTKKDTEKAEDKPAQGTATQTFADVTADYDWAKDAIYALKDAGIISGTSENSYSPASNIKRGDFILILTRMLKVEESFTENFADVPADSYYYEAIGKAKAAGIAQGADGAFMPENTITRQDLITLAYRAFLNSGYISETNDYSVLAQFADQRDIADYAKAPMASMVSAGIIKGNDGNVNPLGFATRAEVAVMCSRLIEIIK